mmetsp:Transcript_3901/g.11978  ORF Transcript_3901/g.11978 Transcript_3901/m.11978 type:complete len:97 (+) Transcript_3901:90-380(+)
MRLVCLSLAVGLVWASAPFRTPQSIIPLFTRELASSQGLELEPLDADATTHYDGATTCVVSPHGQRSAACAKFDQRDPIEIFDTNRVSRNHPLRAT